MSLKRENVDVQDTEALEPDSKRARKSRPQHSPSVDPNSGQKYVFAAHHNSTTIPLGEESDFEDDADAMAYLLSVRSQASGIPHVLVAPKVQIGPQLPNDLARSREFEDGQVEDADEDQVDRSLYNTGIGDARGFYEDGAYIGRDQDWGETSSSELDAAQDEQQEATEAAISKAYFDAILQQYRQLRKRLAKTPPKVAKRLSASLVTYANHCGSQAIKVWVPLLRNTDPNPLQVSLMSKDTVLRILRLILGGKFLRRGYTLPERTSRWIWALLAKLPERGELNHSEVGWVRDLGRRAVLVGRSLSEMAALQEEIATRGLGVSDTLGSSSSGGGGDDEEVAADELDDDEADVDAETETVNSVVKPAKKDLTEVNGDKAEEEDGAEEEEEEEEEGEVEEEGEEDDRKEVENEDEDVAMDIESDIDQGEIDENETAMSSETSDSALEAAKRQLLDRLKAQASKDDDDDDDDEQEEVDAARERSRINMRATLNMILTVAGEFYGQRDLLEFRQPFVGM